MTTLERNPALPELPTVAESGFRGFEVTSWHCALAPLKTPKPVGSTPEALSAHISKETVKYAKLIKQIGLKAE